LSILIKSDNNEDYEDTKSDFRIPKLSIENKNKLLDILISSTATDTCTTNEVTFDGDGMPIVILSLIEKHLLSLGSIFPSLSTEQINSIENLIKEDTQINEYKQEETEGLFQDKIGSEHDEKQTKKELKKQRIKELKKKQMEEKNKQQMEELRKKKETDEALSNQKKQEDLGRAKETRGFRQSKRIIEAYGSKRIIEAYGSKKNRRIIKST